VGGVFIVRESWGGKTNKRNSKSTFGLQRFLVVITHSQCGQASGFMQVKVQAINSGSKVLGWEVSSFVGVTIGIDLDDQPLFKIKLKLEPRMSSLFNMFRFSS
jgi:hypothetical protein